MSMLAEKKRITKWQLNPRGTSLLDSPNLGKQLLEKMGWKSGQGLGANKQGSTDFVKVKVKNDSEGLGFKKTENEWLKTTSEFNELLDHLSTAEESSDQNLSSLEDRSKKSKARVHYHKFTRGKDLSRYSNRDLASIIGPDLMKRQKENEHNSDYSSNQVNRGSSEDYFNKKKKKVKTNLNIDGTKESYTHENEESPQEIVDGEVCKPKKKRKKSKEESELSVQYNETISDIVPPNNVEIVKKKKNKEIETIPTEHAKDLDTLHSIDNGTEKRKRHKKRTHNEVVEDLPECISPVKNLQDVDILSSTKKVKMSEHLNLNSSHLINDESDKHLKKKKNKSSKLDVDSSDIQLENASMDIDHSPPKEKKDGYEENSNCNDAQIRVIKKEKNKKKSKTNEGTNSSCKEKLDHGVSLVSEHDAELGKSRNESKTKKKKSRKNKDAEDHVLSRHPPIDNSHSHLESSDGNKMNSSNKVTIMGNIEKTHVIPQKIDLFTESLLVKHKLATLGKSLPDVEVVLNGEEILKKVSATNALLRKQNLILYYSVNHWKSLLPKREVNEIKLANILLIKRRFKFIGLIKDGLDQIEAIVRSETIAMNTAETPPNTVLGQQKEFIFSLLDRLNLMKQQSWDCTEGLTLKKGEQGIVDQRMIDKVNQIFKKPYHSDNVLVFSKIENYILSNIPAFLETKLKNLKDLVESLLLGKIPKELTRDTFDQDAVLNNYNDQNGNCCNRSWRNSNLSQRGRGYVYRRGQGGFQGSVSYRESHYSAHQNVQLDSFDFENQPGSRGRGRGRYHRGSASFQESRQTTFQNHLSYPEAQKENVLHRSAYSNDVLDNDNAYDLRRGTETVVKITKNKRKKGTIFPSTGTHLRFEPLPEEVQPQPEVSYFNSPASFYHFGAVYRRGEGTFRGLYRGRIRQRGKISQTNYDAKNYAEKCKALNKTPEITFNGVDMNKIPGYAASLTRSNPTTTGAQS